MIYKTVHDKRVPLEVLHRKMPSERACICGVHLDYVGGEWIHPMVNPMDDLRRFMDYYDLKEWLK